MKLGIISDCIHYKTPDGRVGTENHILLKQVTALAVHFSETIICCPFDSYDTSRKLSFYEGEVIQFIPVPQVGGNTVKEKLKILFAAPKWLAAFKKIDRAADIVYQRFPNNLNIPGFFYFFVKRKKAFATYTGTWSGYLHEPATYRFQRWLLRKYFQGPVWVYSAKDETANSRIHAGFSPSYSLANWEEETEQVQQRMNNIEAGGLSLYRLITVGTLIDYKNQEYIIRSCKKLKDRSFPFTLTLAGDGPQRAYLENVVKELGLNEEVQFAGKKNDSELRALYRQSDFVVQAPVKEGFGKVPIEGFFHGVIPVISNTAMAAYMIGENERGFIFDVSNPDSLADQVIKVRKMENALPKLISNGRFFARKQTLEAWASEYAETAYEYFKTK